MHVPVTTLTTQDVAGVQISAEAGKEVLPKTVLPCWAQALLTPGAEAWVATAKLSAANAESSNALAIVSSNILSGA